jgi:hypothetical protein
MLYEDGMMNSKLAKSLLTDAWLCLGKRNSGCQATRTDCGRFHTLASGSGVGEHQRGLTTSPSYHFGTRKTTFSITNTQLSRWYDYDLFCCCLHLVWQQHHLGASKMDPLPFRKCEVQSWVRRNRRDTFDN